MLDPASHASRKTQKGTGEFLEMIEECNAVAVSTAKGFGVCSFPTTLLAGNERPVRDLTSYFTGGIEHAGGCLAGRRPRGSSGAANEMPHGGLKMTSSGQKRPRG